MQSNNNNNNYDYFICYLLLPNQWYLLTKTSLLGALNDSGYCVPAGSDKSFLFNLLYYHIIPICMNLP